LTFFFLTIEKKREKGGSLTLLYFFPHHFSLRKKGKGNGKLRANDAPFVSRGGRREERADRLMELGLLFHLFSEKRGGGGGKKAIKEKLKCECPFIWKKRG